MSTKPRIDSHRRRREILAALYVSPLTARQILALSETFAQPFTEEVYVRRKMLSLVREGYVKEFTYLDQTKYWRLSRMGHEALHGPDKPAPGWRAYRPISPSLERHTRRLADLQLALQISAYRSDVRVMFLYGDGQVTLTCGEKRKIPDTVIGLKKKGYKTYPLMIELDCGTEPVYSTKARESLDKAITFYNDHEASIRDTYRVLTVFDRPSVRMAHFLDRVRLMNDRPQRRLHKAVLLDTLLDHVDPLYWPLLLDEDRQQSAILPGLEVSAQTISIPFLDAPVFA